MYMKHCLTSGRVKSIFRAEAEIPIFNQSLALCLAVSGVIILLPTPYHRVTILPFCHFTISSFYLVAVRLILIFGPIVLTGSHAWGELISKHHFNQKWRRIKMVSTQRLSFCLKLGPVSEGNWYLNINLRRINMVFNTETVILRFMWCHKAIW